MFLSSPFFRYYHFGEDFPENISSLTSAENSSTSIRSKRAPTVIQRTTQCCPIPAPKKATLVVEKSESSDSSPLSSNYDTSCPSRPDSDLDLPSKLLICESLGGFNESDERGVSRVFHDSLIPEIKPVVMVDDLPAESFSKKVSWAYR